MGLLKKIFGKSRAERLAVLSRVQERFSVFKDLLDRHNQSLRMISQLEERHQKGRLSGFHSVSEDLVRIQEGVRETIERMIELGGEEYFPLRDRFASITKEVESLLPGSLPVPEDDYVISFSNLGRTRALSAGTKGANLGEMRSKIGVPVPDGFVISAWACKKFIDESQLHERVTSFLADVHIRQYEDLKVVSGDMREMVDLRPVSEGLAQSIYAGFDELAAKSPKGRFALRSSAVEEDTSFSFAGQYVTFLNVGREDLLDRYKAILASKFTPSAISYLSRHSLSEMELAMGVVDIHYPKWNWRWVSFAWRWLIRSPAALCILRTPPTHRETIFL
jgi:pyruvate,water dikinase